MADAELEHLQCQVRRTIDITMSRCQTDQMVQIGSFPHSCDWSGSGPGAVIAGGGLSSPRDLSAGLL